ncbi:PREDICTED: 39S ribosomal protein L30, mitochondrial [Polistes canadensis]|uniref:39S ribosomal protein L30, mitochondrial n=1 Tax=Polistes canadensis TaxID=91411 RepID=UPI000718FB20|nr:PREDICTED: 39S ribosomal protein L30, mitochondrial [Polistes canadensis]XP_014603377.1 PREDICTED: 39S ribosomal protein L30, mitochondrial [Polistes canadensis]
MASKWKVLTSFVRNYSTPKQWEVDAVKYGKIKYYPRSPNHEDPPIIPSKLLMITLVKPFAGNPYWEKNTLKQLGIQERGRDPVIVKNIPEICSMLWRVKHLVKITPIKLPDQLPDSDDFGGSYLHENGTFYVIPKIDPLRIESTDKFINNPKKLENIRLKEQLRLQWLNGTLP